jgi:hypothetical protein
MVEHSEEEKGIAQVLLKRLVDERIPRLQELKTRVDAGEVLSDFDIEFLEQALEDANHNRTRAATSFPELEDIVGKIAQLYAHITSKALENERAQKK